MVDKGYNGGIWWLESKKHRSNYERTSIVQTEFEPLAGYSWWLFLVVNGDFFSWTPTGNASAWAGKEQGQACSEAVPYIYTLDKANNKIGKKD